MTIMLAAEGPFTERLRKQGWNKRGTESGSSFGFWERRDRSNRNQT